MHGTIIPTNDDALATFLLLYRNTVIRALYRRRGLFVPTVSVKVYYHHSKKQVGMGTGVKVEGSHPKLQAQSGK